MRSNLARALLALASVVAIVALFVVLSDDGNDERAVDEGTEGVVTTEEPEQAPPEPPLIRVAGGEPVDGAQTLEYSRGDRVSFAVVSDLPEELHVHGYDIVVDLEPGEPQTVRFDAEIDGIFEVELHGSGAEIARLRIDP